MTAGSACCSSLSTRIVLFWFSALIPPASEDDVDYYEVLGVPYNAKSEDIRKAYKKKSLSLHPDKILQRGGNPDDYRDEYEQIQQAHTVLVDDPKRQKYNLVNRSSSRFEFLDNDGAVAGAYDNLVKATCEAKSRLVLLMAIFLSLLLLQPILICVKVNHEVDDDVSRTLQDASWILILIPWWLFQLFVFVGIVMVSLLSSCNSVVALKFLEHVAWVVGQVFLALRWDDSLEWDYVMVFIPIYIALGLRNLGRFATMKSVSTDIGRMVTISQLEEDLGKSYEDLTDEEREEIAKEHIIVEIPPDAVPPDLVDPEDAAEFMIAQSPEYQHAMNAYSQSASSLASSIIFGIPLIVLIVLKVDAHLEDTSWWLIFMPVWVYFGTQMCWNCYSCCCASISGDQIVLSGASMDVPADDDADQGDQEQHETHREASEFVDPDSSMRKFNAKASVKSTENDAKVTAPAPILDDGIRVSPAGESTDPPAPTKSVPTSGEEEAKQEASTANGGGNDDEMPEMDEETFENFRQAYEQAENSAMEEQARAASGLCGLLFQFMMVCLIVGKLAQVDDGKIGFNTIWIIFPFFIIAGCALCCTACFIYGAGADGLDSLVERATGEKTDDEDARDEEEAAQDAGGLSAATSPIIVPPPATPAPTADEAPPKTAADYTAADIVNVNTDPNGFYDDDVD